MPKYVVSAVAALILAIICPIPLEAGYLTSDLNDYIAARSDGEFIRVIVVPVSDHNPAAFKNSLADDSRTRADRHRAGITRLKEVAERSQSPILAELHSLEGLRRARNIRRYWITDVIEAEISVAALSRLAGHPAIEKIDLFPEVTSIPSLKSDKLATAGGVEINLKAIKADSAWAAGYDGRGRIVCSFDTGVDGLHPALYSNYRGTRGYPPGECWFPSVDSSLFPHSFGTAGLAEDHGTHVTGIMVGVDSLQGDTIGVAPGADWIAAVAIDVPGSSIFSAFQWAADPDGDPNTVADLPDVINHSWGIPGIGCADIFWEVIDNTEALGIVNVFSAGNGGPAAFSIRNPANRADGPLVNFAVGALDSAGNDIWFASSHGPSDCDSVSIKPNVTAPGQLIRSAVPGNAYAYYSGTSMAAPHVSGAVAILRQKNPDATVDEIKTVLLNSARDLGNIGPDNTFGWGCIDIMEALRQIDSLGEPSLQVARLQYPEINPGDIVQSDLALKNVGASIGNVEALFFNPEPGLTLLTGKIDFGTIGRDSIVVGANTLGLSFSPEAEPGRFYSLDMAITGDGGYSRIQRLNFFVGSLGERTYFHHDTGRVRFTISNYGAYGFHGYTDNGALQGSFIPLGFEGYRLDRDTNDLYEGALLIGVDSTHVSDCAKNITQEPDNDFAVSPGGSIVASSPGQVADQQTVSFFDDRYAEHPIGLTVRQNSYGWAADPDNTFIILEYILANTSLAGVTGIYVGLFLDWDIRTYTQNHGSFLPDDDIGYLCWAQAGDSADFRGVRVLNDEGLTNHRIYINALEVYGSRFTEGRKYEGLAVNSTGTLSAAYDVSHLTATGPFNLDAQSGVDTAAFAIIGGADWASFMESAVRAEQRYSGIPTGVDDLTGAPLPRTFTVHQNYPNPFNPATTFAFSIPRSGRVRVDVFDILGRVVKTLYDGTLPAGRHTRVWDGTDQHGNRASSGVYLYRVKYNDQSVMRKMVLMK